MLVLGPVVSPSLVKKGVQLVVHSSTPAVPEKTSFFDVPYQVTCCLIYGDLVGVKRGSF